MLFPVVIHKDPDSDYSVTIPDMPGCFTVGKTIEEAVLTEYPIMMPSQNLIRPLEA
jgi:HicB_like antitoxin of bacterial toxin-antitoxin system